MQCEDNKYLPPKFSHSLKDLAQLFQIQDVPPADDMSIQSELSQYSSVFNAYCFRNRSCRAVSSLSRVWLLHLHTRIISPRPDRWGRNDASKSNMPLLETASLRKFRISAEGEWSQSAEVVDLIEWFLKPDDPLIWGIILRSRLANSEKEDLIYEFIIWKKRTHLNKSTRIWLQNR